MVVAYVVQRVKQGDVQGRAQLAIGADAVVVVAARREHCEERLRVYLVLKKQSDAWVDYSKRAGEGNGLVFVVEQRTQPAAPFGSTPPLKKSPSSDTVWVRFS